MGEADASKGLSTQAQNMNKDNRSEDFWSSSAIELDHGANQSQRSVSSIAMSNHPSSDPQSSEGIQTDPPEFVNHGKFAVIYYVLTCLTILVYYTPLFVYFLFKFCFFYLDGITSNICDFCLRNLKFSRVFFDLCVFFFRFYSIFLVLYFTFSCILIKCVY